MATLLVIAVFLPIVGSVALLLSPRRDDRLARTIALCVAGGTLALSLMLLAGFRSGGFDLRLMSWGDGSGVPTSGKDLVVVGTDDNGLLHIRIFDAIGNRTKDTDETQLPSQAAAIATLKQQLAGLWPAHGLTDRE